MDDRSRPLSRGGPGRVLTGLLKRIDGSLSGLAVEDPATVAKAVALVQA